MTIPLLVAHRGYARRFPENTLEGLEAALVTGACFVEFDVQLTSDGVPVLFHDADLWRIAGRPERVAEMSLRRLLEIEVGQSRVFGDSYSGVGIPTLKEALGLLSEWPRSRAFIEIKPEGIEHFGIERVVERVSIDLVSAPSRHILISSVGDFLEQARQSGHLKIGLVLEEWSKGVRGKLDDLQPDYVFCSLKHLPTEAERLWPGPWQWVVYEVISPTLALALAARGADLIETMAIGEMLEDPVLGERSCRE